MEERNVVTNAEHEPRPPWQPWLRRFRLYSGVLTVVVTVIVITSTSAAILTVPRSGRFLLSFVGIISLAGAALNGGMAVALWLDKRKRGRGGQPDTGESRG